MTTRTKPDDASRRRRSGIWLLPGMLLLLVIGFQLGSNAALALPGTGVGSAALTARGIVPITLILSLLSLACLALSLAIRLQRQILPPTTHYQRPIQPQVGQPKALPESE